MTDCQELVISLLNDIFLGALGTNILMTVQIKPSIDIKILTNHDKPNSKTSHGLERQQNAN